MSKVILIGVGAAEYVLGAKAGRERYEQITGLARRWRDDPRVQERASAAADLVKHRAPDIKSHVADAAKDMTGKIRSDGSHGEPSGEQTDSGAR